MAATQENMVLRTVYLPKALDQKLRGLAFANEQTKGELIRSLINEALALREAAEAPVHSAKVKISTESKLEVVSSAKRRTHRVAERETAASLVGV